MIFSGNSADEVAAKVLGRPGPPLVAEGLNGFNIIRHLDRYYAVDKIEGPIDPEKIESGDYPLIVSGDTVDEVLEKIYVRPSLVVEGFNGFNIIQVDREFHAILQSHHFSSHLLNDPQAKSRAITMIDNNLRFNDLIRRTLMLVIHRQHPKYRRKQPCKSMDSTGCRWM